MGTLLEFPLPPNAITGDAILRLPHVKDRAKISKSFIYSGAKNGTFPAPIKLGERAVGWRASEIDAWIQSRIKASRPTSAGVAA